VVRRLILSRTVAFTVIGGSRPRGPGTQDIFAGAIAGLWTGPGFLTGTVVLPFLADTGDAIGAVGAGRGGGMDVTPAQVEGGVGIETKRSVSFSERNMLLKFKIWRPVAESSRTVGVPSIMVILQRSSWVTTSSRKGA
jgi:hypothetical protein